MANALNYYNPVLYAAEGLRSLMANLGMGSRMYRGFDQERRAFNKGDTIKINRPQSFTAAAAPATATDLNPGTMDMTVDQWYEVKYGLVDNEAAISHENILKHHVKPATYALALNIDSYLNGIGWKYTPHTYTSAALNSSANAVPNVVGVRSILVGNNVPLDGRLHHSLSAGYEACLLGSSAFTQQQGAGDLGVQSQVTGTIGPKFGMSFFTNQNESSRTTGTAGTLTDTAGTVTGAHAKNATTLVVGALTDTEVISTGAKIAIAGHTQVYTHVGSPVTVASSSATLTLNQPLDAAVSNGAVVTLTQAPSAKVMDFAFHEEWGALVFGRLPEYQGVGCIMASVQDPITGLALRNRIFYEGNNSKLFIAFDVLYGAKIVNPNLGCRIINTPS